MQKTLQTIKFKDDIEFINFYKKNYDKEYNHIGWSYSYDVDLDFAFCIGEYKNCNTCSYNVNAEIDNDIHDIKTCSKSITPKDAIYFLRYKKLKSLL